MMGEGNEGSFYAEFPEVSPDSSPAAQANSSIAQSDKGHKIAAYRQNFSRENDEVLAGDERLRSDFDYEGSAEDRAGSQAVDEAPLPRVSLCMYVCIYVYMYVYMYVCMMWIDLRACGWTEVDEAPLPR